ncbi:protein JINGUBANG-like [Diospyros lotus]|uniref:protein JINGUBANG-like n=1 Tax=Diospyros lotus TaxID=55363 RepID=UPI002257EBE2|nr:protein JINGUBANG-like [Diospyros lotus]
MKVPSWLSTCSATICVSTADTATPPPLGTPPPKHLFSDTSSGSDFPPSSGDTSYSSLQSNLSLQTLPSVPSLQKVSPETFTSAIHRRLAALKPRPLPVGCLAVHNLLLYAASGNEINVFDTNNYTLLDSFNGKDSSSGSVKSISFCKGRVFTAHQDCKIRVWEKTAAKRHKLVATLPTAADILRRFIFPKNYVQVRRHKKQLWIEHQDTVSGLAVNDNLVCSISWDKSLKIWKVSDFHCTQSLKAHDDAINAVVVSADGTIYTGSADRRIKIWGLNSDGKHGLIATLEKHKSAVNALALNNDGSILFSGACDRSILVWEREDSAAYMAVAGALRGHSKAILCLINVSDLLFSGSADRTVRIWQRSLDGRYSCLSVLDGHENPVKSLAAIGESAREGLKVFSGSFDGEIKAWQIVLSNLNSPLCSSLQLD